MLIIVIILCYTFYLVANANFRICKISVYLADARATRLKINIEPFFTRCVRATLACPKTLIISSPHLS